MALLTRAAVAASLWAFISTTSFAQSPAEIIEQARAEARLNKEYEEGLADPDPIVRLAVFEAMLKLDNPILQKQALNYAFSTSDNSLRVAALRHYLLKQARIAIHLSPDTTLSKEAQEKATSYINKSGNIYPLVFTEIDADTQTFSSPFNINGQFSNLQFNAENQYSSESDNRFRQFNLTFTPDNIFEGKASIGATQFMAQIYID